MFPAKNSIVKKKRIIMYMRYNKDLQMESVSHGLLGDVRIGSW